jgi:hypothetical protein
MVLDFDLLFTPSFILPPFLFTIPLVELKGHLSKQSQ